MVIYFFLHVALLVLVGFGLVRVSRNFYSSALAAFVMTYTACWFFGQRWQLFAFQLNIIFGSVGLAYFSAWITAPKRFRLSRQFWKQLLIYAAILVIPLTALSMWRGHERRLMKADIRAKPFLMRHRPSHVDIREGPNWARALASTETLYEIHGVTLTYGTFHSPTDLRILYDLPRLRELHLRGGFAGVQAKSHLLQMNNLRRLTLNRTQFTDESIIDIHAALRDCELVVNDLPYSEWLQEREEQSRRIEAWINELNAPTN